MIMFVIKPPAWEVLFIALYYDFLRPFTSEEVYGVTASVIRPLVLTFMALT